MKKKFILGLLLFFFFNLLVKPFWILGIEVEVQNRVGPEVYGLYFALLNTTFLFNILLDLGLTNFNSCNIARHSHLLSKQFSKIASIKLLLGGLYVFVTFTVGVFIGYKGYQFYLLLLLCVNQFLSSFILFIRSNLSALLLFKTDSILSVLDRFLMILFCALFLWGGFTRESFKIEWFIYSQTLAYVLTALTALFIVRLKSKALRFHYDKLFMYAILRKSLPFAILVLLMTFYNRIDSIFLLKLLGTEEGSYFSGIYASAYRLLDSVNMLAYLFSVLLLPIFSRMFKEKRDVHAITQLAFTLIFVLAVCLSISMSVQSKAIIQLLYKEHIEDSTQVFRVLILGFIPISCTYIFGTLLTAGGTLRQLNRIAAMGALLNIVLDIIFIPKFQAVGASYVSLLAQSLTAILQMIYAIYFFKLRFPLLFFAKLLLFSTSIFLVNKLLLSFELPLFPIILLIAVLAPLLSILFGLIHIKDLLKWVRNLGQYTE